MRHPPRFTLPQFNRSLTARIISRKTISIASLALLIISTWLVTSCIKNDDSTQYLNVTGSCKQQTSIVLIDESDKSVEKDSFPKLYKARRKLFKQYATDISQYLFAKIDGMGQCQGRWMGDPHVELVFVYRPLIGKMKFDSDRHFIESNSQDTRILDSPWVKMKIERSSKLVVRAVFFWNERQFFFDQAMLLGARPMTVAQLLIPLNLKIFSSNYKYYNKLLSTPIEDLKDGKLSIKQYKKAKANVRIEASKRIPVDLLWLLDDFQWTGGYDIIHNDLDKLFNQYKTQYYDITKSLLSARLSSLQTKQRYNNILDLKTVFYIDSYRYKYY